VNTIDFGVCSAFDFLLLPWFGDFLNVKIHESYNKKGNSCWNM